MKKQVALICAIGCLALGTCFSLNSFQKWHTEPGRLPNRAVQSLGHEIQERKIVKATLEGALFLKGENMIEAQIVQDPREIQAIVEAISFSTRDASIAQETPIDCGTGDMPESMILWDDLGRPTAIVFHGHTALKEHGAKFQQLVEKYRQRPDHWFRKSSNKN